MLCRTVCFHNSFCKVGDKRNFYLLIFRGADNAENFCREKQDRHGQKQQRSYQQRENHNNDRVGNGGFACTVKGGGYRRGQAEKTEKDDSDCINKAGDSGNTAEKKGLHGMFFDKTAMLATAPPNAREPVSPINTFAPVRS